MADGTKIEWADATVNAVNGCSITSPGCTNCYAMRLAGTRLKHSPTRVGLTVDSKAGPVWNGTVRLNETALIEPLKWKRPRRIFWNAHGDLFHESVPDEWIDRVFAVCALTPHHTHMILTKRSARMREYLTGFDAAERIGPIQRQLDARATCYECVDQDASWPLPNVWLGVSVEDQTRKARIDDLRETPAAVRFLSCEPLLENLGEVNLAGIDWVIAGGESGPNARPMHPDWARSLRDQCAAAGVACHFKQWGEWLPYLDGDGPFTQHDPEANPRLQSRHVRNNDEPCGAENLTIRVGKKRAGRTLDGRTHDDFPGS